MEGLHNFSTFFSMLFTYAFFGFILLVSYLIYALKGKKYYNNALSLTIIYLIFMPPALGNIDDIARIIIKYIFLMPFILFFAIINIIIYLLIKNKKIKFKYTYNVFYQFLYRIFFLISIVFSIVSVFEQLISEIISEINFEIFYYIICSCNNLYICIIISTMIMYLLGVTNVRTIKECLKNLILYLVIYSILYALLLYLLLNIIKINAGDVLYLSTGIIKWVFAGLIFVKNIEVDEIRLFSKIENNNIKYVFISLIFVILNYCATNIPLLLDSLRIL